MEEIKNLIEQLSQACQSLKDEGLKNKLLPIIDQLKEIVPLESKPDEGMNDVEDMMKTKEPGGFMSKIMGENLPPENTP